MLPEIMKQDPGWISHSVLAEFPPVAADAAAAYK